MQDIAKNRKNPEISVLMCVYNGQEFLATAIDSILAQTFTDFELLIVDDGSTDTTPQILAAYSQKDARIRILTQTQNLGLTKALNFGLLKTVGKYVARMDADDISSPERLMAQYWFLEEHPSIAACGSLVGVIDRNGKKMGEKNLALSYEEIKKKMLFNNQFIHSTLFFRADILKSIGGYNEAFVKSQDYELMFRLSSEYPVVNLKDKLVQFRLRADSLSWTKKDQQKFAIAARWLAIRKYHFPVFLGLFHIVCRSFWLLVPKTIKLLYHKKKMQNLLQQI